MKYLILILLCCVSTLNAQSIESKSPDNFQQLFVKHADSAIEWVKEINGKAGEIAEKTGGFVGEQTPLFLKEYIAWQIWSNLFSALFRFGITGTFIGFMIYFYRKIGGWRDDDYGTTLRKEKESEQFSYKNVFFLIFAVLSAFGGLPMMAQGLSDLQVVIKCAVAPRVVIVEKLVDITKGIKNTK